MDWAIARDLRVTSRVGALRRAPRALLGGFGGRVVDVIDAELRADWLEGDVIAEHGGITKSGLRENDQGLAGLE